MNIKKATALALCTGVMALGIAGQASAYIYVGAGVKISELTVSYTSGSTSGNPILDGAVAIGAYNFESSSRAKLSEASSDEVTFICSGTGVTNATYCGTDSGDGISDGVGNVGDVLSGGATNGVVGSNRTRANDDYDADHTYLADDTDQYANANSRIKDAFLTEGGIPTAIEAIAETQLQSGTTGTAGTTILSNTAILFDFTVSGNFPVQMTIDFDASKYLVSDINAPGSSGALTNAILTTSFVLTNNTNGDTWNWLPNGIGGNCISDVGCDVIAEAHNLNRTIGNSGQLASQNRSSAIGDFTASTGSSVGDYTLGEGSYSLVMNQLISIQVGQDIPEPGTLLLLGVGIAGMGFVRRKKQ